MHTLTFRRHARKGVDHVESGEIYLHHFGTGWQELVFPSHEKAAQFAQKNKCELKKP